MLDAVGLRDNLIYAEGSYEVLAIAFRCDDASNGIGPPGADGTGVVSHGMCAHHGDAAGADGVRATDSLPCSSADTSMPKLWLWLTWFRYVLTNGTSVLKSE